MGYLFNRDFALRIGAWALDARDITNPADEDKSQTTLSIEFDIQKTTSKEPNTASITIYGNNPVTRKTLSESAKPGSLTALPISIEAGYVGSRELIFIGDINYAVPNHDGPNWVMRIEASDGGNRYRSKRILKSFGPGATLVLVLKTIVQEFGIGPGNLLTMAATNPRKLTVFKKGIVLEGQLADVLNTVVFSMGYTWSIQNNVIQVLHPGRPNFESAVLLNSASGLIGSPEIGDKGSVSARALLQASISPGRQVVIESSSVSGTFIVEKSQFRGVTYGNDWYVDFDGRPVNLKL